MYILRLTLFMMSLLPALVFADNNNPSGTSANFVDGVTDNMMSSMNFAASFIHSACFIIGASFLFSAVIKYKEHKRSPLMVPISTVVVLVVLGLVLIGLPFLSMYTNSGINLF